MYVSESDFLTPRGNLPIFIYNQSSSKRQINRQVKSVDGVSVNENLPNGEGKKS